MRELEEKLNEIDKELIELQKNYDVDKLKRCKNKVEIQELHLKKRAYIINAMFKLLLKAYDVEIKADKEYELSEIAILQMMGASLELVEPKE